jgi:hypothetical protein
MDQWEICHVDLPNHEVTTITSGGLEQMRIKREKSLEDDSKDNATARLSEL